MIVYLSLTTLQLLRKRHPRCCEFHPQRVTYGSAKYLWFPLTNLLLPLAIASRTALSLSVLVRLMLKRLLYYS
jgi:hypothetical protein